MVEAVRARRKLKRCATRKEKLSDGSTDLHFSQFNRFGPSVMAYSQFEYDQHLADADWTAQETAYLFDLLRQYDLRFVVVADRYEYVDVKGSTPPRKRSVEVSTFGSLWVYQLISCRTSKTDITQSVEG
jgi:hypothetical protein